MSRLGMVTGSAPVILVTFPDYDTEHPQHGGALTAHGYEMRIAPKRGARTEQQLLALSADVAGAIVSTDPFTRERPAQQSWPTSHRSCRCRYRLDRCSSGHRARRCHHDHARSKRRDGCRPCDRDDARPLAAHSRKRRGGSPRRVEPHRAAHTTDCYRAAQSAWSGMGTSAGWSLAGSPGSTSSYS